MKEPSKEESLKEQVKDPVGNSNKNTSSFQNDKNKDTLKFKINHTKETSRFNPNNNNNNNTKDTSSPNTNNNNNKNTTNFNSSNTENTSNFNTNHNTNHKNTSTFNSNQNDEDIANFNTNKYTNTTKSTKKFSSLKNLKGIRNTSRMNPMMNRIKRVMFAGGALVALIILLPTMLVVGFSKEEPGLTAYQPNKETQVTPPANNENIESPIVSVYRSKKGTIEEVPFEDYIVGVVSREMPATFEMEALKAQALTARTYILNLLMFGGDMKTPEGADVTDTEDHQVFFNEEELREHWGDDFEWKMARVRQAVYETSGDIITYHGRPITATFFSTSNGFTENSEEYWKNEIPYLRSVESPWDLNSPRYKGEKHLTRQEIENALNISFQNGGVNLLSRTTGGRVAKVSIGGKEFTGREIRELLELDSSDFTFHINGEQIVIETHGWGHGVGMSQYGADGMAKEGYTYADIIHHYYQNVEIMKAEQFLGEISFAKDRHEKEYSTSGKKEWNQS